MRTRTISAREFEELANKAEQIGFFKLRSKYTSNWSDMPTRFVTVTRGDKSKQVEDYDRAPQGLHELERLIESKVSHWVTQTDKETAAEMKRNMKDVLREEKAR